MQKVPSTGFFSLLLLFFFNDLRTLYRQLVRKQKKNQKRESVISTISQGSYLISVLAIFSSSEKKNRQKNSENPEKPPRTTLTIIYIYTFLLPPITNLPTQTPLPLPRFSPYPYSSHFQKTQSALRSESTRQTKTRFRRFLAYLGSCPLTEGFFFFDQPSNTPLHCEFGCFDLPTSWLYPVSVSILVLKACLSYLSPLRIPPGPQAFIYIHRSGSQ